MDMLGFSHRQNTDGSVETICEVCFISVAKVWKEKELAQHECTHVCNSQWVKDLRHQLLLGGVRLDQRETESVAPASGGV
jgi:hypothetical protein